MNKKILFIFLIILLITSSILLLSKRSLYKYTLKGESTHWTAELNVDVKKGDKDSYMKNHKFILTYKEDLKELSSMKNLDYKFENLKECWDSHTSELFNSSTENKVFIHESGVGAEKIDLKNEIIKVTVVWDGINGSTETFELKSK